VLSGDDIHVQCGDGSGYPPIPRRGEAENYGDRRACEIQTDSLAFAHKLTSKNIVSNGKVKSDRNRFYDR